MSGGVQERVWQENGPSGLRAVALARTWIGTPYRHQASCSGAGCDCLGLIRGVWRGLYAIEPELPPAYSMDWSEAQGEERLWQAALRHLATKPLGQAAPGDVLLFRMRTGAVAKHLGVQARTATGSSGEGASFVHAYSGHGVKESALTSAWQRRIVARFTFPEELS
ncbi:putative phage cell wall peptidase, NlpC/P60 family [Phaeobacter sp. CECT 5382]|uniref:NlpC/P60 family protein n=1 Tax=Rhodobacterales TaxID=204455 RepID=UPI0006DAA932|nr:NlpC/P60 family protein [Phaeobacter sp. CECT 5382]CUH87454.1 putative phage cell wall peptidase, NlpC/P60 family [Phaeobacter sp. CECT 5382]